MSSSVLLVDDLLFMRLILRDILEKEGFTVAGEAKNGAEALALYGEIKPDVVLLDITMPVMDGLTALKKIRTLDPEAKVIMCSSLGQDRYIIRAIQLGARDFVVKPFTPDRILSAVNKAVQGV